VKKTFYKKVEKKEGGEGGGEGKGSGGEGKGKGGKGKEDGDDLFKDQEKF